MARLTGDVNIVPNPSTKFISWKNPTEKTKETGVVESGFYYWDKENTKNVMVEFPFVFQYLQDAVGIGGYSEKLNTGYFSNEVLDVYETPFDIKYFQNEQEKIIKSGFYYADQAEPRSEMTESDFKKLKAKISSDGKNGLSDTLVKKVTGAKKIKIVYILVGEEIWRMKLEGSSLSSWDDFQKNKNSNKWRGNDQNIQNFISWYNTVEKENEKQVGKTYFAPEYKYITASKDDLEYGESQYTEKVEPYFNFLLVKEPKEELDVASYQ